MTSRIALLLTAVIWLSACKEPPKPPAKPIVSTQASYSGNEQNSGVLKPAQGVEGFPVKQDWIDAYDALLARFGTVLFPSRKPGDRNGVVIEGDHYRVTDAVMERYLVMNQRRMQAERGP